VDTKTLGDRKDKLPVGHGGANAMGNAVGYQQGAFLMATRAETPLTTTEGNEHTIVVTVVAADVGESEVQVATAKKFASHLTGNGPPADVALLVTLAIGAFDSG